MNVGKRPTLGTRKDNNQSFQVTQDPKAPPQRPRQQVDRMAGLLTIHTPMSEAQPDSQPPTGIAPQPGIAQRLLRLKPYFWRQRSVWALAIGATLVAALTEPLIPALFQPLLDNGFAENSLPLWSIPLVVIGLFGLRGLAHFVAQYALARVTNDGMEKLRSDLFSKLVRADLSLFNRQSASALSNTVVYEVQVGASQLVSALIGLTRDGFTLLALVGYLMWLNWQLTLIVFAMVPLTLWVVRVASTRLRGLSRKAQQNIGDLTQVVDEAVGGHRVVKLYGGEDYELLFTIRQSDYEKVRELSGIHFIGHITSAEAGLAMVDKSEHETPLKAQGWDGLRGA